VAILASRALTGRNGGVPWTVLVVDGAADLPAVARCGLGDLAFGASGGDDGKSWQVQRDSGGIAWVEITPGGASFAPPDDNLTDSGDATHRWRDVWVGRRIAASGSINARLSVAGDATLSVTNPTGTAAHVFADGSLRWANSNVSAFYGALSGGPFSAARTFAFPDASGDVLVSASGTVTTAGSNLTVDVTGGLLRQFTVTNSTPGQGCDLVVRRGALKFSGGASFLLSFASLATADRTVTWPDASGAAVVDVAPQTLTSKTLSRSKLASLTVAAIGALSSPTAGEVAFASNGRKPGEGGGAGTGVPAYHDGTAWRSVCDGSALAA